MLDRIDHGLLGDSVELQRDTVILHEHGADTAEAATHLIVTRVSGCQPRERRLQTIDIHVHRMESLCHGTSLAGCAADHSREALQDSRLLPQLFVTQLERKCFCLQAESREMLAKSVVQIFTQRAALLLTDFEHPLLQSLALAKFALEFPVR